MYILGLNAYHGDSSACIYRDGQLITATEEERFRRIKHWAGFPSESIKYCLAEAGIEPADLDHVAISRDPKANALKKAKHLLTKGVSLGALVDRLQNRNKVASVKGQLAAIWGLKEADLKALVHNVEHHRSHLASAFFASSFAEAALLSIDGFGDFTSTMTGIGRGNQIEVLESVTYPHSLGVFYTTFTQFLGFPHYGDEYKVMGLAPLGKPLYVDKLRDVVKLEKGLFRLNEKYFRHPSEGVQMSWEGGYPEIGPLFSPYLIEKFGPARAKDEPLGDYHRDLAASVQRFCEEVIFYLLTHLHERTKLDRVCIAGGVAQNSVANGKIAANTPFKQIYIPPAGHDAGTSIGAALYVYNQVLGQPRTTPMVHGYLGSQYTHEQVKQMLDERQVAYTHYDDAALFDKVTDSLVAGGVVGWFQGRAEFGPRALGHRSILADPRRADAKDILNQKIKRRESFRPFAPSILKEFVPEYFESVDDVPFMEKVFVIKPEKRPSIPAVTHVDGTGRLQTVEQATEPKYYGLIERFHAKTGVPILLNTSFNENEPIVNHPREALECYLRTKMDLLVLGNLVVER
jgi:carbamoyltransferase